MTAKAHLPASGMNPAQLNASKLFAALELSKAKWLITVDAPGNDKRSTHVVAGGDSAALLALLVHLQIAAERRIGEPVQVVSIQEAGLDGFWIHRVFEQNGIESHVFDACRLDRGEPAPSPDQDRHHRWRGTAAHAPGLGTRRATCLLDGAAPEPGGGRPPPRRLTRERGTLLKERTRQTNRIRGLLFGQGLTDYNPLGQDCLGRLEALRTGTAARYRSGSRRRSGARSSGQP
jgi:transposase